MSVLCMLIVLPQMTSFYSSCLLTFPVEDCRIYEFEFMWPILLSQFLLCVVVIMVKIMMFRSAHRLYRLLLTYGAPLLSPIRNQTQE